MGHVRCSSKSTRLIALLLVPFMILSCAQLGGGNGESAQRQTPPVSAGTEQDLAALEEAALTEQEAALTEQEAALTEQEAALTEQEAVLQEKEAALKEKEAALTEQEAALKEAAREEAALKEAALKEAALKEAARKEAASQVYDLPESQEVAVPIMSVQFPTQLNDSYVSHSMNMVSNAATVCSNRVALLTCEAGEARKKSRTLALLAGIAGVATAALVASAELFGRESTRSDYKTYVGISGGVVTGILGAWAAFWNADERGQTAKQRVGVIEQAAIGFTENWDRLLDEYSCGEFLEKDDVVDDEKILESGFPCKMERAHSGSQRGWVQIRQDINGLVRENHEFPTLAPDRYLLPPREREELDRKLVALTNVLIGTCTRDSQTICAKCIEQVETERGKPRKFLKVKSKNNWPDLEP